jgi:hypothetical protein
VILLLRFIGVMNAAVWFGAAVFLLVAAGAFFSTAAESTPLGKFWPGVLVQFIFERFFYLQCICVTVAIAHQLAEWVYLGRNLQRWVMILLATLLLSGLVDGLIVAPRLRSLNLVKYGVNEKYAPANYTYEERSQAAATFKTWHRVSRVWGFAATMALGIFFWKVVHPGDNSRFLSSSKFRS